MVVKYGCFSSVLNNSNNFFTTYEMYKQRYIASIAILFLLYINISKGEHFKHDTKSLNIIQEESLNMNCIRVNLSGLDELIFSVLLKIRIPMVISKGVRTLETRAAESSLCSNLIMQLHSLDSLQSIYNTYSLHRGIIFIIIDRKIDWSDVLLCSTYFWEKYKIYKVFYITTEHSKFYHPFLIKNDKNGALVDTTEYNINDIFKNLYGYPIRVYIFDSIFSEVKTDPDILSVIKAEGVDVKVAYLLEQILNFTMKLQWPFENFFGARLENGSFNGALGRMVRHETDITMTGFFVKDYLTRNIQFSVSVYMDKLCCYVIKSKRIPESILPLYAVNENVWIVYLSVGLLSTFVWMLLRWANLCIGKNARNRKTLRKVDSSTSVPFQYLSVFTDTWILWVRMSIVRFPPYNSERIFAISLCLVSVIIGALFESSLATVYISPRYYKDVNTLEELEKAHLKIFIKHAAMRDDLFRGQNSTLYNNLDKRVILVGEPDERLISIMSKRGGFAVVTREFSLFIRDIYYYITKKIHIIPECPKTYHIAYLYTKDSPYEETFNVALLQFLAAGLINHWIAMSSHEAKCHIQNIQDFVAESSYQWQAFQINHIQLSIRVLVFGHICAALLFFGEIIIHKILLGKINLQSVIRK